MNRYARILDDIVFEIVDLPVDLDIAVMFPPELGFEPVAASVEAGMVRSGVDFRLPAVPELSARDLLAYAADKRWRVETGGVLIEGIPVLTDRESQSMISGAFSLAKDQPDATIKFKGADGFVTLTSGQMIAIGRAVGSHVQACFAKEADVFLDIQSGVITTREQIDAAFVAS